MSFESVPSHVTAGAPSDDSRVRAASTDATRYLCAAAYLDESFARRVLDEVLHQPHRAVAPSYGIDLVPIVRHCLEGRRRLFVRDLVVTGALAVLLVVAVAQGVVLALAALTLWLGFQGVRSLQQRSVNAAAVLLVLAGLSALLLAGALNRTGALGYGGAYPSEEAGAGGAWWWILGLLVVWGAYFSYRLSVHRIVSTQLTPSAFPSARLPVASPAHEQRLSYLDQAQRGNVTVYSSDWAVRPFIGSGAVMTEWNLVTPLRPAQIHLPGTTPPGAALKGTDEPDGAGGSAAGPAPLDAHLLYERARQGIVALGHPGLPPHERIHQLSVQDRVFVAGILPAGSPFLDERRRPVFRLHPSAIEAVDRAERGEVRHYQTVRMAAWRGELEVTGFLYVAVRGGMLFVEFVATQLPSLRPRYHAIDTYERFNARVGLLAGVGAIGDLVQCLGAPLSAGRWLAETVRLGLDPSYQSRPSREIERQLAYDYGARTSVRELGTQFSASARFQDYDANERVSLVERRILEVVVNTLQVQGYDVSDLAGQATTIINNSTVVGGSIAGTGISVGAGAHSFVGPGARGASSQEARAQST